MNFKVGELRKVSEGLIEILKIDIPVKPSYWLARIANKFEFESKAFEKARMALVIKHAKKDKEGSPMLILEKNGNPKRPHEYNVPNMEAFNKEFEELAEQEIEINIDPIKLDALGDIKIKPVILAKLEKIIEI